MVVRSDGNRSSRVPGHFMIEPRANIAIENTVTEDALGFR